MMPREKWTDERLDDLNTKVDRGFAETKAEMRRGFAAVDRRFAETKAEMRRGFAAVDRRFAEASERFDRLEGRFEHLEARFDGLNRTLIGGFFVLAAALVGSHVL